MRDSFYVPPWVHSLKKRRSRDEPEGGEPPAQLDASGLFSRGSAPELHDDTVVTAMPAMHDSIRMRRMSEPRTTRRGGVAKLLFLASFAALAATVTVAATRMWRDARPPVVPIPAAVASVRDGRLELAADRRTIARIDRTGVRWTAAQPVALDSIEIAGPLLLGRTSGAIAAIDLDAGTTRFTWELPAGERWAAQSPIALGACLFTITIRGNDAIARCLAIATGAAPWTAKIAGGRECAQPPAAVPGAYLVQCPGWTTVIDDRNGGVSFDANGIGLVQRDPDVLLRGGAKPQLAAWSPITRRFARTGARLRGAPDAASSAVLHNGRVVVRATSASDQLAVVAPKTGAPTTIAVPEFQLADDAPLTLDCGTGASPRFQLLELAPRAGATFDPAAAQHRVLALLDAQAARLAWTSRKITPPRRAATSLCRHGHYFVPIELRGESALWIVDAESGATAAALAFAAESGASFANLTADQIDADRIVGVGRAGAFELRWHRGGPLDVPGLRDARADLDQELGRLP